MKCPDNIVINNKNLSLTELGLMPEEWTVFTNDETFLPRVLVKFGFFPSTSQVKKNRPDLWCDAEDFHMDTIKIGHKRVWIFVGKG